MTITKGIIFLLFCLLINSSSDFSITGSVSEGIKIEKKVQPAKVPGKIYKLEIEDGNGHSSFVESDTPTFHVPSHFGQYLTSRFLLLNATFYASDCDFMDTVQCSYYRKKINVNYDEKAQLLCGDMPKIEGIKLRCVVSEGVTPNFGGDITEKIKKLITLAEATGIGNYFPEGEYRISSSLIVKNSAHFIGSPLGKTIFKFIEYGGFIGNTDFDSTGSNVMIANIYFDAMNIVFKGAKHGIIIKNNVFYKTLTTQIELHGLNHKVIGNIMVNGQVRRKIIALKTESVDGVLIEDNFIGNYVANDEACRMLSSRTCYLLNKLRNFEFIFIDRFAGEFRTGWYSDKLSRNIVFKGNYISGTDHISMFDRHMENIIYLKNNVNVDIVGNYFTGWTSGIRGGIMIQDCQSTVVASNIFNHEEIHARCFTTSNPGLFDTFIFNNKFINSPIDYYQTNLDNPLKYTKIRKFIVFKNEFIGLEDKILIGGVKTNSKAEFINSPHHFRNGNRVQTKEFTEKSKLEVIGMIPQNKIKKYLGMKLPNVLEN